MNKREKAFNLTKGRCFYCGCKLEFNNFYLDHHIPKAKGGKFEGNTVPACWECNALKSDKDVEEFRESINECMEKDIHAKIIAKYYHIKKKPIKFYYEKMNLKPL